MRRVVGRGAAWLALLLVVVVLWSGGAHGQEPRGNFVLAGGQQGGIFALHGAAFIDLVQRNYPGIRIDYSPGGGVANLVNLQRGRIDFALSQNSVARAAVAGTEPFREANPDLRSMMTTYETTVQFMVMQDSGIESVHDIRERQIPIRVAVGDPGSTTELACRHLFQVHGMTYQDIERWGGRVYYKTQAEGSALISDGTANVLCTIGTAPMGAVQELERTVPLKMLSIDEEAVAQMVEEFGYAPATIPAGAYAFMDKNVTTAALLVILATSTRVADDVVYAVTKTIAENLPDLAAAHPSLRRMDPQTMWMNTGIELHPGAERYYREIGAIR